MGNFLNQKLGNDGGGGEWKAGSWERIDPGRDGRKVLIRNWNSKLYNVMNLTFLLDGYLIFMKIQRKSGMQ